MVKKKDNIPAKNDNTWLSTTEFGKKIDVTRDRVVKGIKSGILSGSVKKTKIGKRVVYKIHAEKGAREWADNIDPSKKRDDEKQIETKEMGGTGSSHYQKAKAHKEFFAAKLAELDYQQKAGKLVSADRVKAESFKIARRIRDSILSVPEKISAEVAAMDNPREISIYMKEQLAAALKDLGDLNGVASRGA